MHLTNSTMNTISLSNDALSQNPALDNEPQLKRRTRRYGKTPKRTKSHKFRANSFVTQSSASFYDHYEIIDRLGEGGYGEVFVCEHKESCDRRAVKILKVADDDQYEKVINEFNILKGLDHPNLIKTYNFYHDKSKSRCYIVSDLYEGGELFDDVSDNGALHEDNAAIVMNQILSCINYLHSQGIAHRDLKLENILLAGKDMRPDDMKVIDFGLSTNFDEYHSACFNTVVGSSYYLAPEVLSGAYGPKCDLWSCGVIAYVLLSGDAPFYGDTEEEVLRRVVAGDYSFDENDVWKKVSYEAKDFIRLLLSYDEEDRPSARQALRHPWLRRIRRRSCLGYAKRDSKTIVSSLANLEDFSADSKLEQAVYAFISSQLITTQEKDEIDDLFRALDFSCDGRLSKDELKIGYRVLLNRTLSEHELDEIIRRVNFSCSGEIEYSEFVVAAMNQKLLLDDDRLLAVFHEFDQDGTNTLTAGDLSQALDLERHGEFIRDCTLQKLMSQNDINRDGSISFLEFKRAMLPEPAPMPVRPRRNKRAVLARTVRRSLTGVEILGLETVIENGNDSRSPKPKHIGDFYKTMVSALNSNSNKNATFNPAA